MLKCGNGTGTVEGIIFLMFDAQMYVALNLQLRLPMEMELIALVTVYQKWELMEILCHKEIVWKSYQ